MFARCFTAVLATEAARNWSLLGDVPGGGWDLFDSIPAHTKTEIWCCANAGNPWAWQIFVPQTHGVLCVWVSWYPELRIMKYFSDFAASFFLANTLFLHE